MRLFGLEIKRVKPKGATIDTGYDASANTRRLKSWNPGEASPEYLVSQNAPLLRARSRDMVRKNPHAKKAINTLVSNMVGKGIRPQIVTKDLEFKKDLMNLWERWCKEADAQGNCDFYGLQSLACRSMIEAGEGFGRFRSRKLSDGLSVPIQIQLLEPDQLNTSLTIERPDGSRITDGIEYDAIGRRKAYHFYRKPPQGLFGTDDRVTIVPADEVFHLFKPERIGQNRGLPWLTQILVKLYELDQYEDAELVRKKTAALFTGFITRSGDDDAGNPLPNAEDESDESGVADVSMEPGTMQVLAPGEDVKFSEPADLGDNYKEFLRTQLQAIAAGAEVLYEQLTGDLRNVNYSSIRAGLVEFRRQIETYQQHLIVFQMCIPAWKHFITAAMVSGAIKVPQKFVADPDYMKVNWIGQGFDWVDPLKDVQADKIAVRSGFKSRSRVVSEYGSDVDTIHDEIESENSQADKKGLVFDTDPRYDVGGKGEDPDSDSEDDEDEDKPATTDQKVNENEKLKKKGRGNAA